jgi:hypothetical protein
VQGAPTAQVPAGVGSWQRVIVTASFTAQQSWPGAQHSCAQQNPSAQAPASIAHGTGEHMPLLQNGLGPGPTHDRPHAPQLLMSFASLTHVPPQQLSPHAHWAPVAHPPPAPEDALLEDEPFEDELLEAVVVTEVLEEVVLVVLLADAPPWPPTGSPVRAPHAGASATTTAGHLAGRTVASLVVVSRPRRYERTPSSGSPCSSMLPRRYPVPSLWHSCRRLPEEVAPALAVVSLAALATACGGTTSVPDGSTAPNACNAAGAGVDGAASALVGSSHHACGAPDGRSVIAPGHVEREEGGGITRRRARAVGGRRDPPPTCVARAGAPGPAQCAPKPSSPFVFPAACSALPAS